MTVRYAVSVGACAAILSSLGSAGIARAQSPFTIHRPPDGSTVREKVRIDIPRASVGAGGFVSFFLDDKFQVAVSPEGQSAGEGNWFTYLWDTKAAGAKDGEHTIRAVLFEPAADSTSATAVTEKGRSEVKVNVANLITDGPRSLILEYKYVEGQNFEYVRTSKSTVEGGTNDDATVRADKDLAQTRSRLVLDIQDVRKDPELDVKIALVRNKLEALSILTSNGREVTLDPIQLSGSMYQELLPDGTVHYETGAVASLTEFSAKGLPIDHTLDLPLLPSGQVTVGDDGREWKTENQRLDIPGLASTEQPEVTLTNKLIDLEWEHNRPTAKIHQHYDGHIEKAVKFGNIRISSPHITYDRDVYFAYNSGTLIKTVRTLTIEGRTRSGVGQIPSPASTLASSGGSTMQTGYPGSSSGGTSLMDRVRAQKNQPGGSSGYPGSGSSGYPGSYPGMGSGSGGYPGGSGSGSYPGSYPGMRHAGAVWEFYYQRPRL